MVTRKATLYKIPFKECQGALIQDERATIQLYVEWPQNGGDNPILVLNVAEKKPSIHTKHDHVLPTLIHHYAPLPQQQDNLHPIDPSQQYKLPDDVSATMTSRDHNNVSATIAAESNSAAIEQIKNYLMSPVSSISEPPQTSGFMYSVCENAISTHTSNTINSFFDTQLLTISPPLSAKPVPAITPNAQDSKQSSPSSYKSIKPVICNCNNPTNHHDYNCSVVALAPQQTTLSLTPDDSCSNANNRTPTPRMSHQTQSYLNDAHSIPSAQAVTSVPFSNGDYIPTSALSQILMTSASQQSSFSGNNSTCPANKTSSMIPNNQHQSQAFVFPPASSMNHPSSTLNQGSISSSRMLPTNSSCQQNSQQMEQSLISNLGIFIDYNPKLENPVCLILFLDSCQTRKQVINRINSPPQQHQSHVVSAMTPTRVYQQQGNFPHQNTFEMSNSSSITHDQQDIMNDSREDLAQRHSSSIDQTIRSPVSLDSTLVANTRRTPISSPDIDGAIGDFSQNKGMFVAGNMSNQKTLYRQEPLPSLPPMWVQSDAGSTVTYLSPLEPQPTLPICNSNSFASMHFNSLSTMPHITRQSTPDYNTMQIALQHQSITERKKRIRVRQTNEAGTKRGRKTNASKLQLLKTPVPVIPIESVLIAHQSSADTQRMTAEVDLMRQSEHIIQLNYTADYEFQDDSPKNDERVAPLTSPLSIQTLTYSSTATSEFIPNPLTTSVPITNSSIIYERYLSPPTLPSSSTWQENQVTLSVVKPLSINNTCSSGYQPLSQVPDHGKSNECTQMSSSQSRDNTTHLVKTRKDNRLVHKTMKSASKSSRKTNPVRKYTSKNFQQQQNLHSRNGKLRCTRCNSDRITDITHHEFFGQKNLVFECQSCGNASLRSNVSVDERKRRLSKVAAEHLDRVECQFCHRIFHSHNEYLMHLKNDHASDK
ncbi:unnamed protein product [Adineta ricciae]|uniref:C2H2-type domain-containing protein n=1 Tax=Adineta ricciae TaxID=249248 RepID=A0A816BPR5_ADIRI|nr:unnamed protein product [Adineta ricciae]